MNRLNKHQNNVAYHEIAQLRLLKMQIRQLQDLLKYIPYGMTMSTYAILHSYLSYETLTKNKNEKITFIELLLYLNDNGFTIIPDLDIRHKSEEALFDELIKGITKREFVIQIRDEYLDCLLKKYSHQIKGTDWYSFKKHVSPLHFAVTCNDYPWAKSLIDAKADVNMCAISGCILESAIKYADEKIVRLLLDNGANVHTTDPFNPMKTAQTMLKLRQKGSPERSQNILNLLKEAESYSFKELKPLISDKIVQGTHDCLPTDLVNIITLYDPRTFKKAYFKTPEEDKVFSFTYNANFFRKT